MPQQNPASILTQSLASTRINWPDAANSITHIGKPPTLAQRYPTLIAELLPVVEPLLQQATFLAQAPASTTELFCHSLAQRIRHDIARAIESNGPDNIRAIHDRVAASFHPQSDFMRHHAQPLCLALSILHAPRSDPNTHYLNALTALTDEARPNTPRFANDPLASFKSDAIATLAQHLTHPFHFPQLATFNADERCALLIHASAAIAPLQDADAIDALSNPASPEFRELAQQFRFSRFDPPLITPPTTKSAPPKPEAQVISLADRIREKRGESTSQGQQR